MVSKLPWVIVLCVACAAGDDVIDAASDSAADSSATDASDSGVETGTETGIEDAAADSPVDSSAPVDADSSDAADMADAPDRRPLSEREQLFVLGFNPDETPRESWQSATYGIRCLGAALAWQRANAGADFGEAYVARLRDMTHRMADALLEIESGWDGGWGEPGRVDAFGDGTINPADTAYAYNQGFALWCLAEAAEATDDAERRGRYEESALRNLRDYQRRAYIEGAPFCDTCGFFYYSNHRNDRRRYPKNTNVLMGLGAARVGAVFDDAAAAAAAVASIRTQSREVAPDGQSNLDYFAEADERHGDRPVNTHNALEAMALLHAGEMRRSPTYLCRASGHFRAWRRRAPAAEQATQLFYASCHFAGRDGSAMRDCRASIEGGRGVNNRAGIGLVSDYWPENTDAAASFCE